MIGRLLGGRYRIRGQIGEGGMASVFTAVDERLDRRVAVKVMHSRLAHDKNLRNRFLLEAKTLSGFDHPNIIRIFDYSGDDQKELWIVTEILRGSNLSQFAEKFPKNCLHPVIATLISEEVCKALSYAHEKGIYHRDVKPENIFILNDGRVKLMDFGIAKDANRSNITMTGTFMGSPSYMPPEQVRGAEIDHRSDIYSLCVMFYEITTGKLPFPGNNPSEVITKILAGQFLSPAAVAPWLPEPIVEVILKGMAGSPSDRFYDVLELKAKLRRFLEDHDFKQSHLELEAYFRDRHSFDRRLKKAIKLSDQKKSAIHHPTTKIKKAEVKSVGPTFTPKKNLLDREKVLRRRPPPQRQRPPLRRVLPPKTIRRVAYPHRRHFVYPARSRAFSYMIASSLLMILMALGFLGFIKLYKKLDQIQKENQTIEQKPHSPESKSESSDEGKSLLKVRIKPKGSLYVDGTYFGHSKDPLFQKGFLVAKGEHRILVKEAGFQSIERIFTIEKGPVILNFNLSERINRYPVLIETNRSQCFAVIKSLKTSQVERRIDLIDAKFRIHLPEGEYQAQIRCQKSIVEQSFAVGEGHVPLHIKAYFP